MAQLNVQIDEDLYRRMKVQVADEGMLLKCWLAKAIEAQLAAGKPVRSILDHTRLGKAAK